MKANRKFKEGQEAVSAVIGVILMVAITVAIAATVYVYVSGMVSGNVKNTPTMSLVPSTSDHNVTCTVGSISNTGTLWADVTFTFVDNTNTSIFNTTTWTSGLWGGQTLTFKHPTQLAITGGQIITIKGTSAGVNTLLVKGHQYTLTLVYRPTGGSLCTSSWTQ